jgi:hypothetical protein
MKDTLAGMYESWWAKVAPNGCHPTQQEEMRRSFYTGAFAMFALMTSVQGTDDECVQKLDGFKKEIDAFQLEMMVKAGKA